MGAGSGWAMYMFWVYRYGTDGCGIRLGNVHSRGTARPVLMGAGSGWAMDIVAVLPVTCTASTIHQGYPISNYAGGKKTLVLYTSYDHVQDCRM